MLSYPHPHLHWIDLHIAPSPYLYLGNPSLRVALDHPDRAFGPYHDHLHGLDHVYGGLPESAE